MQDLGFISLHRELVKKAIWKTSNSNQNVILITLLLMANYSENEWQWKGNKFKVNESEFVTSSE